MLRHLVIIASFCLLVGCGPDDRKSQADLSNSYEMEFGTLPPSGITVVHARIAGYRDWGAQWLQIRAETNLIDSVILKKFTKRTLAPEGFSGQKNRYTPDWWILPPAQQLEFYTCDEWTRGNFSSSHAGVAIDRATGMIYFLCDRIN